MLVRSKAVENNANIPQNEHALLVISKKDITRQFVIQLKIPSHDLIQHEPITCYDEISEYSDL